MLFVPGAQATLITKTYTVHVINAPFAGTTGTGSFTYDDTVLDGSGNGTATLLDGLALTLTLFGQTFTELDDADTALAYPKLAISNFIPALLEFQVWENGANPSPINQPGVEAFYTVSGLTPGAATDFDVDIRADAIPEPDTPALLGLGLPALIRSARRRQG